MSVLDDFFGDGSLENEPECSFCGGKDSKLVVSISDHDGPTHWHHVSCKVKFDLEQAKKAAEIQARLAESLARDEWEEA